MIPQVTVSPQSATDATSGAGGIGANVFNLGGNPNAGWLTGSGGVSWPLLAVAALLVFLLVRR